MTISMMCEVLATMVQRLGHEVVCTHTLKEGLRNAGLTDFDIVFLDVFLPDGNGLGALPEIRSSPSHPEVIIITGSGDPDGAALAIKNGAWDYIQKPSSLEGMTLPFIRALQYRDETKARIQIAALKRGGGDHRQQPSHTALPGSGGSGVGQRHQCLDHR